MTGTYRRIACRMIASRARAVRDRRPDEGAGARAGRGRGGAARRCAWVSLPSARRARAAIRAMVLARTRREDRAGEGDARVGAGRRDAAQEHFGRAPRLACSCAPNARPGIPASASPPNAARGSSTIAETSRRRSRAAALIDRHDSTVGAGERVRVGLASTPRPVAPQVARSAGWPCSSCRQASHTRIVGRVRPEGRAIRRRARRARWRTCLAAAPALRSSP